MSPTQPSTLSTISGAEIIPVPVGSRRKIHYVVSSHWDREWYLSFQGFRYRLVQMLDRVLEHLVDPRWTTFVMDGQVVPLLDYLEIRPEQRTRLREMVASGRVLAGPWYCMPDERILSGEALVRNLLHGFRETRALGAEPMRYGYVCDIFGHCAQLPQIFVSMGINHAFVWRGTNDRSHPQIFRWRSPDGSEVLAHKASDDQSYSSARYFAFPSAAADRGESGWQAKAREGARRWWNEEVARANVPVSILLEGWDHNVPRRGLIEALEELRAEFPDAEITHSDFMRFATDLEPYRAQVPVVMGELVAPARDPAEWSAFIQGCLSSHVPNKQANTLCETLLTQWAEPLVLWASLSGHPPQAPGFLVQAWRHMLLNHPHDSICGCSIDQVHKDMEYRFDQARLIAEELILACLDQLAGSPEPAAKGLALTVLSPCPVAVERIVTLEVDYPHDMPAKQLHGFPGDPVPCFDVLDEEGRRIDYQLLSYVKKATEQDLGNGLVWGMRGAFRVRMALPLRHEGLGARSLRLAPRDRWYRATGSQLVSPHCAENAHLRLTVQPSGTLSIFDKATGRDFTDCCLFEDQADAGDGWYHVAPTDDQRFLSSGFATGISVIADGPYLTTFRIEKRMVLPEAFDWIQRRRSEARRELVIILDVSLRAGERRIECEASFDNTIRDHRLRVLFASHVLGQDSFWSQAYTCLRRRRGADPATSDWKECDVPERDTQGIVGVDDDAGGLAILAGEGLHEAAVRDDADGTIALTLMRGFRKTVRTPMDGRSQLLQPLQFRWLIVPFSRRADPARLWNELRAWHAGLRIHARKGDQPAAARWLLRQTTGAVVVTACKPAEDGKGIVVRVFNPADTAAEDDLVFLTPFTHAIEVTHAEESLPGAVALPPGAVVRVRLPAQRIASYRIQP